MLFGSLTSPIANTSLWILHSSFDNLSNSSSLRLLFDLTNPELELRLLCCLLVLSWLLFFEWSLRWILSGTNSKNSGLMTGMEALATAMRSSTQVHTPSVEILPIFYYKMPCIRVVVTWERNLHVESDRSTSNNVVNRIILATITKLPLKNISVKAILAFSPTWSFHILDWGRPKIMRSVMIFGTQMPI